MKKFEYKILTIGIGDLWGDNDEGEKRLKDLNKLGKLGWEIIHINNEY